MSYDRKQVDDLATLMLDTWNYVEDKPLNVSYVATIADVARAVLDAGYVSPEQARDAVQTDRENIAKAIENACANRLSGGFRWCCSRAARIARAGGGS